MSKYRIEKDSLGEMRVPEDAYYGAQTARAVENFPVSGLTFPRQFIRALGIIKRGCARANVELGDLDAKVGEAIAEAATEVIEGKLDAEFPLDIYQTGSGTSTNMNANEVIANRAAEIMGKERGHKSVHPNDHVNMSQSSNDVIPTAIHVAAATAITTELIPALEHLGLTLEAKSEQFDDVVKSGRTHLMDATPVRLGQEFGGFERQVANAVERAGRARDALLELALGGTAVGTGINRRAEFPQVAIKHIGEDTGLAFYEAMDHFEAQGAKDACVEASGQMKTIAVSLVEDRQRYSTDVVGAAHRHRGDHATVDSTRFLHHAGQDKPRDLRIRDDGECTGDRLRRGDHAMRAGELSRAQCHDAADGIRSPGADSIARQREPHLRQQLHFGDHRQRFTRARIAGTESLDVHVAGAQDRLRQSGGTIEAGLRHREAPCATSRAR